MPYTFTDIILLLAKISLSLIEENEKLTFSFWIKIFDTDFKPYSFLIAISLIVDLLVKSIIWKISLLTFYFIFVMH